MQGGSTINDLKKNLVVCLHCNLKAARYVLHLANIGVARILSGVHFAWPKKLTTFFSRRPQNTLKLPK